MAQYTKKAILQTFEELLEKTPFDKLTVSAIVAKCEISPNTFYYHFDDIYDLLDTWLALKKEIYAAHIAAAEHWTNTAKELLCDMRAHKALIYHLFHSLSRERLEKCVFESTDDTFFRFLCKKTAALSIPEAELRSIAEYNTYSFLGFFLKFLWNDMNGDIDAGLQRISSIFESNIQGLKDKYTETEQ